MTTSRPGTSPLLVLDVNGIRHEVDCDPQTPLLYVLRNDLGLFGAKFGCGMGLCGACSVLVDGTPMHACDTPASFAVGKQVVTVEGLGGAEREHPLQRSFVEHQALQCGYCTAGMIVTAAALLQREAHVDEDDVRQALDGNLCRCGAHNRIVAAVLAAQETA